MNTTFLFVVDTTEYAGSFAIEMCGFIKGRAGIHPHLLETIEDLIEEDSGKLHATPGYFNDGLGNHHRADANRDVVVSQYEKAVQQCYRESQKLQEAIERGPSKFPAFQSVAISLEREPTKEEVEFMVDNAKEFCQHASAYAFCVDVVGYLGCRLIRIDTVETLIGEY